jgi:hypothetical protein
MTRILSKATSLLKALFSSLWLSASSAKFYQNILSNYGGYGIKYILNICLFSSFVCSIIFLNNINKLQDYFSDNQVTAQVENIDHIISQLPDINYNGATIKISEEDLPSYINGVNGNRVVALDPANKLTHQQKQIPIILSSDKIIISFFDPNGQMVFNIPIKYNQLFGNSPQLLSQEVIKSRLSVIFHELPKFYIYIVFPLIMLWLFVKILLINIFLSSLLYFAMSVLEIKASLKDCIRVTLFTSGIFIFLYPIILLLSSNLINVLWLLLIWPNLLMVFGIFMSDSSFSKSK